MSILTIKFISVAKDLSREGVDESQPHVAEGGGGGRGTAAPAGHSGGQEIVGGRDAHAQEQDAEDRCQDRGRGVLRQWPAEEPAHH